MNGVRDPVEQQYDRERLLESIVAALRASGRDPDRLTPADLAPVDAFHVRGRAATVELAERAGLEPGLRVLDVGCGLGGAARYLAAECQCRVTGIDVTRAYVDVATALSRMVGLSDQVAFQHAGALDMPFDDGSFDVVLTEHVQMNIADKYGFYREIGRVLRPDGRLLFHDVFLGDGGPLHYPVPWADKAAMSFLVAPDAVERILKDLGFVIDEWVDESEASLEWFVAAIGKLTISRPPSLGVHLLMGDTAGLKLDNNIRNLREGRFVVCQALIRKSRDCV